MIALAEKPIDPALLLDRFLEDSAGSGGVVSFTGVVRGEGAVDELWLDHHEVMTMESLTLIADRTRTRFAIDALTIVHRVGSLAPGDPIVFVAASAPHRRSAFEAVDYAMDRLKIEAILWKRERRGEEVHWVEARAQDQADAARWEQQS